VSLGLQEGFRRGISAANPFGIHEYRNVIGNQRVLNFDEERWYIT